MRRFIIALALATTALTTACDADQQIYDSIQAKTPKSDFHPDLPITNGCGSKVCKSAH